MHINSQKNPIETLKQDILKSEQAQEILLQKIAILEAENKRLEAWLTLISKGYTVAINQLNCNARMP